MLHVAVCEDTREELQHIGRLLEAYCAARPGQLLRAESFCSAEALLKAHGAEAAAFDLYLLDILMPELNGIELARTLRRAGCGGAIVFLTHSREHAFEAFSVRAYDYLLKPVAADALFRALDEVADRLAAGVREPLAVPTPLGELHVAPSELVCVEVTGHVFHYHLADGRTLRTKVMRITFEEAAASLLADGGFLRPHQSFVISAAHVRRLAPREFEMDNGMLVPISRARFSQIKAEYLAYLEHSLGQTGGGTFAID